MLRMQSRYGLYDNWGYDMKLADLLGLDISSCQPVFHGVIVNSRNEVPAVLTRAYLIVM